MPFQLSLTYTKCALQHVQGFCLVRPSLGDRVLAFHYPTLSHPPPTSPNTLVCSFCFSIQAFLAAWHSGPTSVHIRTDWSCATWHCRALLPLQLGMLNIAIGNDSNSCMQVRYGSMAAEPPSVIPLASIANPHGSPVQERLGHALHKLDHSDVQISNSKSKSDSIKQIHDLLADIDAAALSKNSAVKCNAAVPMTRSAMSTACDSANRADTTTEFNTTACARNPQTSIRASTATAGCSNSLERTDSTFKVVACKFREVDDMHSDICACNTAGAALPPSAISMDDHFCRWQSIARQNQSTGSSAYPPLPYWAAQIAPYPACEMNSKRYQSSFWDKCC